MVRLARAEVFAPDEIAIVHVMNRTVRRCFLMGDDPITGVNYDHRKQWIESELVRLAAGFGIDLLCFSILSNHFHLILRSRYDVVLTWDDSEVARRWLLLCPVRKPADGALPQPTEAELNSIRNDPDKVCELRSRLSDISWWMRLLCQRIAQRANREEEDDEAGALGKFWQNRFKAVRLLDEAALLACAAYVDLNPIRAAMAESLETSDFTSVQRRINALKTNADEAIDEHVDSGGCVPLSETHTERPDHFLSPIELHELRDALCAKPASGGSRCSNKGFLPMTAKSYIELLDWTARQVAPGKKGTIPKDAPVIFTKLKIKPAAWCELVSQFGKLFSIVAGQPHRVDEHRSRLRGHSYRLRRATRELLSD